MNTKRGIVDRCSSKGQVTIFIIVGIILVFSSAAIFYFVKTTSTQDIITEAEAVVTNVPQEFRPLQAYTENCLFQVGKQGLILAGQQGGYIYPDVLGDFSASEPTESLGLNLDPTKVPYWHYNAEKNAANKVTFASQQPELHYGDDPQLSVEAQLQRFVIEKIDSCLQGYRSFEQQGFLIRYSEDKPKSAKVEIGEESINLLLEIELSAEKGEARTTSNRFFVKIPLPFKHYYDTAIQITEAQKLRGFLERQAMELISAYSRRDINAFPPISDTSHELFSVLSWSEQLLEQKFKGLLTSYVPMLQFLGSSNFYYQPPEEGKILARKILDNSVLPLLGAEDLEVNFDYFGWPVFFKTNSEEGIIKPTHRRVNFEVLNFATQRFETHYDISYPVLVTLRDPVALGGEGFEFLFALEANIRNNAPPVNAEVREVYPAPITSLACNEEQKNSPVVRSVVVDSFTKEPLDLVQVAFSIPEQESCEIGLTDATGIVESRYPKVYGGELNFVKTDYLTNFYPIDTAKLREGEPVIIGQAIAGTTTSQSAVVLHRFKPINISVQVKEVEKCVTPLICKYTVGTFGAALIPHKDISCEEGLTQCFYNNRGSNTGAPVLRGEPLFEFEANGSLSRYHSYYLSNNARRLQANEEAVITLERVGDLQPGNRGANHLVPVSLKGDIKKEVSLVPGIYKVTGIITQEQNVVIPEEERCISFSILTWDTEECFTMDRNSMQRYISGMISWETEETYITITPDELYTSNELTLYLPAQDLAKVPARIKTEMKECASFTCVPGLGCLDPSFGLFESCLPKDINVNAKVIEDLQVPGKVQEMSSSVEVRSLLRPRFD